tara:strand:+ start:15 stop:383 length:369 start_codon:yes stop_codon:yes gene_type:complete
MYPIIFGVTITTSAILIMYTFLDKKYRYNKSIGSIEKIETIADVINYLKKIESEEHSTENMTERIYSILQENPLSEESLIKLSKLHKTYAKHNGIEGYAINMLWSCIVSVNITNITTVNDMN